MKINLAGVVVRIREADLKVNPRFKDTRCLTDELIRASIDTKYRDPQTGASTIKNRHERASAATVMETLTDAIEDKIDVVEFDLPTVRWVLESVKDFPASLFWAPVQEKLIKLLEACIKTEEDSIESRKLAAKTDAKAI